jgi:hypothetical protein
VLIALESLGRLFSCNGRSRVAFVDEMVISVRLETIPCKSMQGQSKSLGRIFYVFVRVESIRI